MKRWMVAPIMTGFVLSAGLPALASAGSSHGSDSGAEEIAAKVESEDKDESQGHGPPPWARGTRTDKSQGNGPPAWAHDKRAKRGKGPSAAWKKLTPEQRAGMMARLAREHAQGMEKWADCVAAKGDDCAKPLPPGLAKRG